MYCWPCISVAWCPSVPGEGQTKRMNRGNEGRTKRTNRGDEKNSWMKPMNIVTLSRCPSALVSGCSIVLVSQCHDVSVFQSPGRNRETHKWGGQTNAHFCAHTDGHEQTYRKMLIKRWCPPKNATKRTRQHSVKSSHIFGSTIFLSLNIFRENKKIFVWHC